MNELVLVGGAFLVFLTGYGFGHQHGVSAGKVEAYETDADLEPEDDR